MVIRKEARQDLLWKTQKDVYREEQKEVQKDVYREDQKEVRKEVYREVQREVQREDQREVQREDKNLIQRTKIKFLHPFLHPWRFKTPVFKSTYWLYPRQKKNNENFR